MSTEIKRIPPLGIILLIAISLGWGVNWPIMKMVITEVPRWTFRGSCLVVASFGMFAIAHFSGNSLKVPAGRWLQMWGLTSFNIIGWNVFAIYGISMLPSGRAAILGYTMPIWSMALSAWLLNEGFSFRRALGLALGMSGMGVLLFSEISKIGQAPMGVIFMLAAAICWACGLVLFKRNPVPMPTSSFTAWQMLLGGLPVMLVGLVKESVDWSEVSFWPYFGLVYNVFVAFLFCYWAWNRLVQLVPVAVSSLGSLIVPVVGVFSGMLILGEQPQLQDFLALILVMGALATVVL
ncbi:MAG TPA: EamA family transporter [Pseudomonadales bacterium]|nr:EamA family transporter [Pseudomonadales bacterium]